MPDLLSLYSQIQADAHPQPLTLEGRPYVTRDVRPVMEPQPKALEVSSLTALVDYLAANVDSLPIDSLVCHVESPKAVSVRTELYGPFKQRDKLLAATTRARACEFNAFLDAETFNVKLQACFCEAPARDPRTGETRGTDRDLLLSYIGNVQHGAVNSVGDDGVSQRLTVKTGVANLQNVILPNPVILRPYRTFVEVEQPASLFVFRAKDGPYFALFEADNGAWEAEAMASIKAYVKAALPDLQVIA
jgi:hypothetical protein